MLVLLGLLILLSFTATGIGDPPAITAAHQADRAATDLALYDQIVAGVRHGGGYYDVTAQALRANDYPLRPFVTFRLPALAMVQAALPPLAVQLLLYLVAILTAFAWLGRIMPELPRLAPRIAIVILLAGSMVAFTQTELAAFHEIWAAQLIALSLALRRPGRWVEAVALGLAAMLIRETAALFAMLMALAAWIDGERREAIGWGVVLAIFAAVVGAHAWAVAQVTGPLDPTSPGWLGMQGFGLFVKSVTLATALQVLPLWLAGPLVALAIFGWFCWDEPAALRMAALLAIWAVLMSGFARLDTFYWGLMVSPVLLVGLVFVPDGLRDCFARALDRRPVRVQIVRR
ncbi:hypothetical protein [Stakelama tenebrarum]|uniref:hypothetical protein n=1 Tax=Stakelama tenebrarum TaxID=2711215 RepID=UPI001D181559|nr:hypothetical protein [Sphingosinithalassobacter tenebrarum]